MSRTRRMDASSRGFASRRYDLIERSIPLATHLFKAGYIKRQEKFRQSLAGVEKVLKGMPDFELVI
jgi:hypothetical protein